MLFDAVVLAGGRSSRLGGSPKAGLEFEGESLLDRAIASASAARTVVVVGPVELPADLDDRVIQTREAPPFGGPVAALAAGLAALDDRDASPAEQLLVIACDMPRAADGVTAVLEAAEAGRGRGVAGFVAVDEERHPQPLLAAYDRERMIEALDDLGPELGGTSMRALLARLDLIGVEVPPGTADDVDTWADAARFGIEQPEENDE